MMFSFVRRANVKKSGGMKIHHRGIEKTICGRAKKNVLEFFKKHAGVF